MEKLIPAQKSTVTKSSTERLRLHLMRSGYAEEVVLAWSRDELMNKYAELLIQGVDPAVVRSIDPELEKARMAQEKELREKQLKADAAQRELQERLELEKLALEKQKLELEVKRLEAEEAQRELEREKLKQDAEIKSAESEGQSAE